MGSASKVLRKALDRRLSSFGTGAVLFYNEPIQMESAKGVFMYDKNGRPYLDMYNNVPSVGHCHPRVVKAIREQVGKLNIHTRYIVEKVDQFAERLLETFPDPLDKIFLTSSGSEANDLAMRIAESATGGRGFIVTRSAYHGNTSAVTAISPSSWPGQPAPPHIEIVEAPDQYRFEGEDLERRLLSSVEIAISNLRKRKIRLAGMIADTVFSSDGIYTDPPGFLTSAINKIRSEGGVFIADEVQPGFGRTGSGFWGFSRHNIVPDICTLGKPMGNGYPMGGVVMSTSLQDKFTRKNKYFNTFGGSPVAAAAGLAVIDVIRDEKLIDNARTVGSYLIENLKSLSNKHLKIGDVRGAGLFIAVEFVKDRKTKKPNVELASSVINELRNHGILIGAAGAWGNILKIRPPLCFNKDNAEQFLSACDDVVTKLTVTKSSASLYKRKTSSKSLKK